MEEQQLIDELAQLIRTGADQQKVNEVKNKILALRGESTPSNVAQNVNQPTPQVGQPSSVSSSSPTLDSFTEGQIAPSSLQSWGNMGIANPFQGGMMEVNPNTTPTKMDEDFGDNFTPNYILEDPSVSKLYYSPAFQYNKDKTALDVIDNEFLRMQESGDVPKGIGMYNYEDSDFYNLAKNNIENSTLLDLSDVGKPSWERRSLLPTLLKTPTKPATTIETTTPKNLQTGEESTTESTEATNNTSSTTPKSTDIGNPFVTATQAMFGSAATQPTNKAQKIEGDLTSLPDVRDRVTLDKAPSIPSSASQPNKDLAIPDYMNQDGTFKGQPYAKGYGVPATGGTSENDQVSDWLRVANMAAPGLSLEGALTLTGKAIGEGKRGQAIAGGATSLLSGARSFLSGLGMGKRNQYTQDYMKDTIKDSIIRRYTEADQSGDDKGGIISQKYGGTIKKWEYGGLSEEEMNFVDDISMYMNGNEDGDPKKKKTDLELSQDQAFPKEYKGKSYHIIGDDNPYDDVERGVRYKRTFGDKARDIFRPNRPKVTLNFEEGGEVQPSYTAGDRITFKDANGKVVSGIIKGYKDGEIILED